jgi:hypothetical protein
MTTSSNLIPLDLQNAVLDISFLNAAYAICWLGQRLPPFTTDRYAAIPFQLMKSFPNVGNETTLPDETWTTTTNIFSTSLSCSPAEVTVGPLGYTFDNGRGCVVPDLVLSSTYGDTQYMVNYIGYYDNADVDWALENPNCTAEFSNSFLALWAQSTSQTSTGIYSNLTSLFCETEYNTQEYTISVNASSLAIIDGNQTNSNGVGRTAINIDSMVNTTALEYILATGVNPPTSKPIFLIVRFWISFLN